MVWHIDSNGRGFRFPPAGITPQVGSFVAPHGGTFAVASAFKTFHDLKHVPWAIDAIETMASRGIVQGETETRFNPLKPITRAEFLVMLVRALELEGSGEGRARSEMFAFGILLRRRADRRRAWARSRCRRKPFLAGHANETPGHDGNDAACSGGDRQEAGRTEVTGFFC